LAAAGGFGAASGFAAAWGLPAARGVVAGVTTGGGGAAVAAGGCFGVGAFLAGVVDRRGAGALLCGVAAAESVVVPLAAGRGTCTGGATVVAGVTVLCGFARWPLGDETMTFAAGGAVLRVPIAGRCTVPESSSSAIAAAPSKSGITGAATRRAIAQLPRPLSCSSAGNGRSPLPVLAFPLPEAGIQESRSDGNLRENRPSLFPGNADTA
jgi:hypothetical protein